MVQLISLTREQAELVVSIIRSHVEVNELLMPSVIEEHKELASEIERQLAEEKRCTCRNHTISFSCPTHGEDLARDEIEFSLAQQMERWLAARGKEKLT